MRFGTKTTNLPSCTSTDTWSTLLKRRPMVLHARMLTGTGGGPDKTVINSPRFLDALGFDSVCLFYHPANDSGFEAVRQRANAANAKFFEIEDDGFLDISRIRQTIHICRSQKVDIWHGHDYKTNLVGLIASKFHKMKLVTTAHGWVDFSGRLPLYYKFEQRWILPRYEQVICVSESVMNQAINGGTPQRNCQLIENAIDHNEFQRKRPSESAKQQDFALKSDQFLVGSVGRLSKEKGFDLLIRSVASLISRGQSIKLLIAGEGPEKEALSHLIDELGVTDHVKLLGFRQDTIALLETLDVFVLSSHREGLPNVVLEAMSIGVPVVATAVDGVPKIITNGKDGRIIPPNDIQAMSQAIELLLTDRSHRCRLAEAARQTISQKWGFDSRMQKVANLYKSLLQAVS